MVFCLRAISKGSDAKSCRSSLLLDFVLMCGVGAFAGEGHLRHGVTKERLWRRGVQPGVSRDSHGRSHCQCMLFSQLLA